MHLWSLLLLRHRAQRLRANAHRRPCIARAERRRSHVVQPRSQATIVQAVTQQVKPLRKQSVRSAASAAMPTAMVDSAQRKLALNIFFKKPPISGGFSIYDRRMGFNLRNGLKKYSMLA